MARRVAVNSLVAVAAVVSISAKAVLGHPLCYLDDSNPSLEISATFCSNEEPDGFCCTADVESQLQSTLVASGASDDCADLYKEVNYPVLSFDSWALKVCAVILYEDGGLPKGDNICTQAPMRATNSHQDVL